MQWPKQRCSDVLLPKYSLQLFWEDTEEFLSHQSLQPVLDQLQGLLLAQYCRKTYPRSQTPLLNELLTLPSRMTLGTLWRNLPFASFIFFFCHFPQFVATGECTDIDQPIN